MIHQLSIQSDVNIPQKSSIYALCDLPRGTSSQCTLIQGPYNMCTNDFCQAQSFKKSIILKYNLYILKTGPILSAQFDEL